MSAMRSWSVVLGLCFGAASAEAVPFLPEVDFRGTAFAVGHGHSSLAAVTGLHSFSLETLSTAGGPAEIDGALFWSAEDGFGISGSSYEQDEIEGSELLRLHFSEPLFLERLLISDLFIEAVMETGAYSTNGGASWISFSADGLSSNGEIEVAVHAEVQTLLFSAPGQSALGNHDFSLAGFDANRIADANQIPQTPEPTSGLLVAAGLLALARRASR